MKKFIFICTAVISILSCTLDQTNVKETDEINTLKIESVQRISNNDELQKIEYGLLNEKEKLVFWKDRFNLLLEGDEFNDAQKQLLQELVDKLTISLFIDTSNDDKEYFKNIFVPNFLESIKSEFTYKQIDTIFYSGRTITQDISAPPSGSDSTSSKSCDCNGGSLFGCGASQSCGGSTCRASTTGCGFLWLWECNGICRLLSF